MDVKSGRLAKWQMSVDVGETPVQGLCLGHMGAAATWPASHEQALA